MIYCSECGFENPDEAQFCRNCGSKLKAASNEVVQKQSTDTVIVNKNKDSIITKVFYKTDKYTGELRVSKTNSISIAVFILMFLFGIFSGADVSVPVVVVAAILFGLLFAVPTFIIGNLLGWAIDRLTH